MSEMHFRQPGFAYSACGPFTKIKTRIPKFKETRDSGIYIGINQTKPVLSMRRYIEISNVYQEEQHQTKYYVRRHLALLVIQSMRGISMDLHQWSTNFLIRSLGR